MASPTIAFTFAGDLPRTVAERLLASVRDTMPGAHIIHQTDETTEGFEGCEVIRRPRTSDFAEFFLGHLKAMQGDFIKLDYDCIVMQSLAGVFQRDFDVGLTIRDDRDVSLSNSFRLRHPHNSGVMFSKGKHTFWQEVYNCYMSISDRDGWMDVCDAMETAVKLTKCNVVDFPAFNYNYTPVSPYERLRGKYVVHYKGNRKHWNGQVEEGEAGRDITRRVNEWKAKRWGNGSGKVAVGDTERNPGGKMGCT